MEPNQFIYISLPVLLKLLIMQFIYGILHFLFFDPKGKSC